MNSINAFIIGAQKAGTTSLYQWLGQHPDIYAPYSIKDYHFFTKESLYKRGEQHFKSFYSQNNAKIHLHAAVNYLFYFDIAAPRLYKFNPNSKIIICLREPIDRTVSAYKYFVRTLKETHSFKNAIGRELNNNVPHDATSHLTYLSHGKYLDQIKGFQKYFDRSQVHLVFFEELIDVNHREKVMTGIFNFLNINSSFRIQYTHLNKSRKPKSQLINFFLKKDFPLKGIKNFIPFSIRKRIALLIEEKNISEEKIEVKISPAVQSQLNDYFKSHNNSLANYLNKDLTTLWE